MKEPKFNKWNSWDPLETVILGSCYTADFFREVANPKIRSAMSKICNETCEDLEHFENVLKDFGSTVIKPVIDPNDSVMNYVDDSGKVSITHFNHTGKDKIPYPPLQPRNHHIVIGNDIFYSSDFFDEQEPEITNLVKQYSCNNSHYFNFFQSQQHAEQYRALPENKFNELANSNWKTYHEYKNDPDYFQKLTPEVRKEINLYQNVNYDYIVTDGPRFTQIGKDLYYNTWQKPLDLYVQQIINEMYPQLRLNYICHEGDHSDGCFSALKEGVMLSLCDIQNYDVTFPDWDVFFLPDQETALLKLANYRKMKNKARGKFWVPGEEENDEFIHYVNTWLDHWLGYCQESAFDINVLSLDENHVCLLNNNKELTQFCKKHKIEPIHVPMRHKYFWDGGLSCYTLDLKRKGTMQNYFPDRQIGIIDSII